MGIDLDYLKKHLTKFVLGGIILTSFLLMIFSAQSDSLTTDEKVHISAGYLHTWEGNYTFNSEHPPLLNDLAGFFAKFARPTIPKAAISDFEGGDQWEYADLFFYESGNNVDQIVFWARLPFIILTLGLIYLVFLWAKTLFGKKAGLLAATLVAFSPNILAHGRLATTDIGLTFFFVLTAWLFRKYLLSPSWKNSVLLGLGLGLLLLSKFSGLIILPIILAGLLFLAISQSFKNRPAAKRIILKYLGHFLMIFSLVVILIGALYAFSMRNDIRELSLPFQLSKTFQEKTIINPVAKWLIVPFDKFVRGMGILSDHNTGGHWSYLNGRVDYRGWWYYFPLVLWYKMTLAELALFALAGFFIRKRLKKELIYIIILPLIFLAVSMIGRIDIGMRHVLVILPFLYIFVSFLVSSHSRFVRALAIVLVISQVVIGILAFPNYLAYFNQIAGGSKNGIKHLADSNLDWNQNMKRFAKYAKVNNINQVYELCWDNYSFEYYGIEGELLPTSPVKGVVVICAQQLVVIPEGFDISWVTAAGPPDEIIGHTMYVWRFDLPVMP